MQAIKKVTNLMIMFGTTVIEPSVRPETSDAYVSSNYTLNEAIVIAKAFEGSADILFFKSSSGMTNHPTGFNQEKGKTVVLRIAQSIKESGAKIIVAPNGGFGDPDLNDEFIASGKTDLIAMARPLIADPEYGKKVYEGRAEDVVPCIMCNKCHGISMIGHLFYKSLGNLGYYDTAGKPRPGWGQPASQHGWGLKNMGPFTNLLADSYWSGTEYAIYSDHAWDFNMYFGSQGNIAFKGSYSYLGLAVRTGTVVGR